MHRLTALLLCAHFFIAHHAHAAVVWLSADDARPIAQRSGKQTPLCDFLPLKTKHYGSFLKTLFKPAAKDHCYKVISPKGISFHVIGSMHNLPIETLSPSTQKIIAGASHVYVENAHKVQLVLQEKPLAGLSKAETAAIYRYLGARIYLKPQGIYCTYPELMAALENYNQSFGMDAEIELRSFALNKPLWSLDRKVNAHQTRLSFRKYNLTLTKQQKERAGLRQEVHAISQELSLLQRDPDAYCQAYIKQLIIPDLGSTSKDAYLSYLRRYQTFNINDLSCNTQPSSRMCQLTERNDRWLHALNTVHNNSVVCVGLGHLPDLFAKWKRRGYKVMQSAQQVTPIKKVVPLKKSTPIAKKAVPIKKVVPTKQPPKKVVPLKRKAPIAKRATPKKQSLKKVVPLKRRVPITKRALPIKKPVKAIQRRKVRR